MTTKTFSAAEVVAILRGHAINPDETFEAASGPDYGHVEAWSIGDAGYVISCGGNGKTYYEVDDNCDDLRAWLIHELDYELDYESTAIEAANVDGEIDACGDECTNVAVMILRSWYGPRTTSDLAREDDSRGTVRRFADVAAAKEWIEEIESEEYSLANNEASAPDYVIVQA